MNLLDIHDDLEKKIVRANNIISILQIKYNEHDSEYDIEYVGDDCEGLIAELKQIVSNTMFKSFVYLFGTDQYKLENYCNEVNEYAFKTILFVSKFEYDSYCHRNGVDPEKFISDNLNNYDSFLGTFNFTNYMNYKTITYRYKFPNRFRNDYEYDNNNLSISLSDIKYIKKMHLIDTLINKKS